MLFFQKSLGVEISPSGVAFALLSGSAAAPRLERVSYRSFTPGTIRVSLREQNILDPAGFTSQVKDAHNTLLYRGNRLSVTLPDTVGRIMLLDVEGRFKSRTEGLDIIRWKLKKSLPFDVADTHLDYQQLTVRENGSPALRWFLARSLANMKNCLHPPGFYLPGSTSISLTCSEYSNAACLSWKMVRWSHFSTVSSAS